MVVGRRFNQPRMTARQQGRKNVFTAFVDRCSHASQGSCLTAAEQAQEIAASDDAACADAGTKPGTPAYAKCREDMSNRRQMSQTAARIGMQNQIWSLQGH